MNDYDYCNEAWNWQGESYFFQRDLDPVPQNEEDLSYMFDETTPVKDCGDFAHYVSRSDHISKKAEEYRESSSIIKRRRMLHFSSQATDHSLHNEEIPYRIIKSSERDNSSEEILPETATQGIPGYYGPLDNVSTFCYESLDQSSEGWIAECFNDAEMHFNTDDMNFSLESNFQTDISEYSDVQTVNEADVVQHNITRTLPNIVFKGRKTCIQTPTELASSVAYPFAFIKPCGVHGDVTLKDINQKIRNPRPRSNLKQIREPCASYLTSAFSGKPVVGKTKIHTEGGKGSITIMLTKG